ncbi:hypothetical protein, partial [Devosia sp.]|uniref:hypothetical protein n=1 Tax=Devosia sp. TaxID=1871048 RepID=UPI0035B46C19
NHFDFEPGVHPLPSSPVKGEVPLRVRGNISPHTAAGTLPSTERVGEGCAAAAAFETEKD